MLIELTDDSNQQIILAVNHGYKMKVADKEIEPITTTDTQSITSRKYHLSSIIKLYSYLDDLKNYENIKNLNSDTNSFLSLIPSYLIQNELASTLLWDPQIDMNFFTTKLNCRIKTEAEYLKRLEHGNFRYAADTVLRYTNVVKLNLAANYLGDYTGAFFAETLRVNTTLTALDLTKNNLCNEGTTAIAEALKENITLTDIDLSGNNINAETMGAVQVELDKNKSAAAYYIRDILSADPKATGLDLRDSTVDEAGEGFILKISELNRNIIHADYPDGKNMSKEVEQSLKRNKDIVAVNSEINLMNSISLLSLTSDSDPVNVAIQNIPNLEQGSRREQLENKAAENTNRRER